MSRRAVVLGTVSPPNPEMLRRRLSESAAGLDWHHHWNRYWSGGEWWGPVGAAGAQGVPRDRTHSDGQFPASALSEDNWRALLPVIRDICDTNPLAIGFLGHVVNFTLGNGSTWKVVLRGTKTGAVSTGVTDADGDGKPDLDPAVKRCQEFLDEWRHFAGWGEACSGAEIDLDGEDRSPPNDLEHEAVTRAYRDGEVNLRFFAGEDGLAEVRFIDPERIRTPPTLPSEFDADGPDERVACQWGVFKREADPAGNTLGYWVCDPDNPADGEVVAAGRVAQLKLNVDGCVFRGVSDFFPVHADLERCRKLLAAMAENAAILSKIAYLRQHAPATTAMQVSSLISAGTDYSRPRPSPTNAGGRIGEHWTESGGEVHDLSSGLEYVPAPVLEGASGFIEVEQAALRAAGMRWQAPEYFSGDASNANMASTYMAGGPFERAGKRRQKSLESFELAVAARVLAFGLKAKRLTKADVAKCKVLVTFPSPSVRGEQEQVQVASGKLQLEFSKQTLIQELGGDPEVEFANTQAEQQREQAAQQQQQPGDDPQPGQEGDPDMPVGDALGDVAGGMSEGQFWEANKGGWQPPSGKRKEWRRKKPNGKGWEYSKTDPNVGTKPSQKSTPPKKAGVPLKQPSASKAHKAAKSAGASPSVASSPPPAGGANTSATGVASQLLQANVQTKKLVDEDHNKWEVVIHDSLVNDGFTHVGGSDPADVKGTITHKTGKQLKVILDGKLVTKASMSYSVDDSSRRNKLAEAGPDTLIAMVALNNSPNAGTKRGVYLIWGVRNFTATENAGAIRLLSSSEVDDLTTPTGRRLLGRRLKQVLESVDLQQYHAITKAQAQQGSVREIANLGITFQGSLNTGHTASEMAEMMYKGLPRDLIDAFMARVASPQQGNPSPPK